jgi:hypothetical protein
MESSHAREEAAATSNETTTRSERFVTNLRLGKGAPQDSNPVRRRATPVLLRVAAALLAAVALGAGAPRADASQIRVSFDDESAEAALDALARRAINDDTMQRLLGLPGYGMILAQRGAKYGLPADHESVRETLAAEIRAAAAGEAGGGTFAKAKRQRASYRDALLEFRRVSGRMQWQVTSRLNEILPPSSDFRATAYLVVGGDAAGFAFSHRDDLALRLGDFVGGPDGEPLDTDLLASVLAHELFHVGFRAAGGLAPRAPEDPEWVEVALKWGPETVGEVWRASGEEEWNADLIRPRLEAWVLPGVVTPPSIDRYLSAMSRLMNEGCAVYAELALRHFSGSDRLDRAHEEWMTNLRADLVVFESFTDAFVRGAEPADLEAMTLAALEDNGPFYRIGFMMAERIDKYVGRRALHRCLEGGPLEFFETYFGTHPLGPDQIDSGTQVEIERLIREIRALGDFDPAG